MGMSIKDSAGCLSADRKIVRRHRYDDAVRNHRRVIPKVLPLLVACVVVNVAMAWLSAAIDTAHGVIWRAGATPPGSSWQAAMTPLGGHGPTLWKVDIFETALTTTVGSYHGRGRGFTAHGSNPEAILPSWATQIAHPSGTYDPRHTLSDMRVLRAHGWPCRCLYVRFEYEDQVNPIRVEHGLQFRIAKPGKFDQFPLHPIYSGFVVNSICYVAAVYLVFFAPFALRRMIRRRRGQCSACAYPIGTSGVCTECGVAVTPKAAPA